MPEVLQAAELLMTRPEAVATETPLSASLWPLVNDDDEASIHAITRFRLRPECWMRLLQAVPSVVAAVRGSPGCLAFDVYVSVTRTGEVTMIEAWDSVGTAAAHAQSDHLRDFHSLAAACAVTPPQVQVLTPA